MGLNGPITQDGEKGILAIGTVSHVPIPMALLPFPASHCLTTTWKELFLLT